MRAAFPVLAVLVLVAFGRPFAARAQSIPSPYRYVDERQDVGLFVGPASAGTGRFGYGPSGGTAFGARYGLQLTGPLSLEGVVGLLDGTRDVISPSRPEGDRSVGTANVTLVSIDARLKLTATGARAWHGLQPFIVFGGGAIWDTRGEAAADQLVDPSAVFSFRPTFVGVVGAGGRWFATRRFGVRTDGTFSLWKLHTPGGFGDPQFGLGPVSQDEWVRGLSLTASLFYRW